MGSMAAAASSSPPYRLLVGTFNTPELFLLSFDGVALTIERRFDAVGNHSWLALNAEHTTLLATCWTEPPSIASYHVATDGVVTLVNTHAIASRSGYVTVGKGGGTAYTAGGASGEVLALDSDSGKLTATLQRLDYITGAVQWASDDAAITTTKGHLAPANDDAQDGRNTMDFGGLRHGAHSADLSPDGRVLYVADIGRNCVWVHDVDERGGSVSAAQSIASPRPNDGPRHVWPHPAGEYVYVLQEHSSVVDVFRVGGAERLTWVQSARIIPNDVLPDQYWADEVRTIATNDALHPTLLVASTRGLQSHTKGYVALFALEPDGLIQSPDSPLDMWQTPTSGGWANAVEPSQDGRYVALTDSETGLVLMLAVTPHNKIVEVARVSLGKAQDGSVRGAATAVWL